MISYKIIFSDNSTRDDIEKTVQFFTDNGIDVETVLFASRAAFAALNDDQLQLVRAHGRVSTCEAEQQFDLPPMSPDIPQ